MKKILVYGMTDNPGGIESYLISLLPILQNHIQLDFVTDFESIAYGELLEKYGSKVYYIPAKGKGLWAHIKAFYRILKINPQYKVIYFNVLDAGVFFTQLIPFVMRRKILTHSHNGDTDKPKLHKLCKPFLKITSGTKLACSKLAANHMFGTDKNVYYIKNSVNAELFRYNIKSTIEAKKSLNVSDRTVVCHIGRLTYQKNPFRMLNIFKKFIDICPNAILLSVGTGDLEKEVIEYANKLSIQGNVRFMGKCKNIPQILAASDVFFLPSLYEGLPIVAIEAQAAGLPLVISENITKETDITGNIVFKSLNESDEIWANELLKASKQCKKDTFYDIKAAGFDSNIRDKEILELFNRII